MYKEDVKAGWKVGRVIDSQDTAISSLVLDELPANKIQVKGGSQSLITLIAYGVGYSADATANLNLWLFKDGKPCIAEKVGELTLTFGSAAISKDLEDGSDISGLWVDTISLNDKWTPEVGDQIVITIGPSGNNLICPVTIDTLGRSYLYVENTTEMTDKKIVVMYSYMSV